MYVYVCVCHSYTETFPVALCDMLGTTAYKEKQPPSKRKATFYAKDVINLSKDKVKAIRIMVRCFCLNEDKFKEIMEDDDDNLKTMKLKQDKMKIWGITQTTTTKKEDNTTLKQDYWNEFIKIWGNQDDIAY